MTRLVGENERKERGEITYPSAFSVQELSGLYAITISTLSGSTLAMCTEKQLSAMKQKLEMSSDGDACFVHGSSCVAGTEFG